MAVLTVQTITRAGLEETLAAAAAGGDSFPNDGRVFLYARNGDVSDKTVTIATQKTVDGKAVADDAIVVTAAEERMIGPFPPGLYNDSNGRVQVTYSAETSVTVAAIRLP